MVAKLVTKSGVDIPNIPSINDTYDNVRILTLHTLTSHYCSWVSPGPLQFGVVAKLPILC